MKIGLIVYGLDRPLTGIGRYTLELLKEFERQGADVTLLVAGGLGDAATTSLEIHQLQLSRLAPALLSFGSLQIAHEARQQKFDIIHDPTGLTVFAFGTGKIHQVVTVHDVIPWSFPNYSSRFDTIIYRYWLPYRLPKADHVVTVSEFSKSEILKYLNISDEKISVVYNGVSPSLQPLEASDVSRYLTEKLNVNYPYLLFIGNLTERKNIATLLKAFAMIKSEYPTHRVVIVGPSTFRSTNIENLVQELGISERVILLGPVPDEAILYLYNGADAFLFPSLYEGFGLPPLESMACGTPAIVSDQSSLPEVVGDAAMLVSPTDSASMADAIYSLLNDASFRQQMIDKGRNRAAQFTWATAAKQIIKIYETL